MGGLQGRVLQEPWSQGGRADAMLWGTFVDGITRRRVGDAQFAKGAIGRVVLLSTCRFFTHCQVGGEMWQSGVCHCTRCPSADAFCDGQGACTAALVSGEGSAASSLVGKCSTGEAHVARLQVISSPLLSTLAVSQAGLSGLGTEISRSDTCR